MCQFLSEIIFFLGKNFQSLVIGIGICVGIWNINRQHEKDRELQIEKFSKELNLQIYEKFNTAIEECQSSLTTLYATISNLPFKIQFHWEKKEQHGLNPDPIEERSNLLLGLKSKASEKSIKVIRLIEQYLIVFPKFKIFRDMLSYQHDAYTKLFITFFQKVALFLPIDVPVEQQSKFGMKVFEGSKPNADQIKQIENNARLCAGEVMDLQSYLGDLNVELQNYLLSDLFKNKLKHRIPADKKYKVVKTDSETIKELNSYLETQRNKESSSSSA